MDKARTEAQREKLEQLEQVAEAAESPEELEAQSRKPEAQAAAAASRFWFVPWLAAAAVIGGALLTLGWYLVQ